MSSVSLTHSSSLSLSLSLSHTHTHTARETTSLPHKQSHEGTVQMYSLAHTKLLRTIIINRTLYRLVSRLTNDRNLQGKKQAHFPLTQTLSCQTHFAIVSFWLLTYFEHILGTSLKTIYHLLSLSRSLFIATHFLFIYKPALQLLSKGYAVSIYLCICQAVSTSLPVCLSVCLSLPESDLLKVDLPIKHINQQSSKLKMKILISQFFIPLRFLFLKITTTTTRAK